MAKLFPELVFTRGVQKGQRVALSKTMNIVGRDKTCDIAVQDEYASRQHARLVVEGSRVRLVNTSPNGTRVNGKPVEQAVLADGDLVGIGLECEARFEPADGAEAQRAGPSPAPASQAQQGEPAASPEAAGRRRSRKPTAIVWVGVYVLVLFVLFMVIQWVRPQTTETGGRNVSALTDDQIEQYIGDPLKGPHDRNDQLAREALDNACRKYEAWQTGTTGTDHLYHTLQDFKTALAYLHTDDFGPAFNFQTQAGELKLARDMMAEVKKELFDKVRWIYRDAYIEQRQGHWQKAQEKYHELMKVIPEPKDPIILNALAQLNAVNANLLKAKSRGGPRGR